MTAVTLEHVTKRFMDVGGQKHGITAVDNISLKLTEGEVLGILGPSGCGKSTLLRIMSGLVKPDSGNVLYDNVPLDDVPLQERGVGMVFQEGALIPHWEARGSVGFFLKLRKREHEVPERITRISKITGIGLEKLLDRHPRQLSGGEQQRVSVARALTRDMRLLLFDEPFANLDAKLRTSARIELKRLLNEFPVTSVYVTHDQTEAIALSRRIAIMRNGAFEQVGTYQQLYESPVNLFVAGFVGTPPINTFEGRVADGQWWGENFGGFPVRTDLPNGTPVTMAIRPQYMNLKPDGIAGVVGGVVPFLEQRYKLIEVWLGKEHWQISVPLNEAIEFGTTIYCGMDEQYALYFDTKTGLRIG